MKLPRHSIRNAIVLNLLLGLFSPAQAQAEIVVIVSAQNSINRLSAGQVERLMLAKDPTFPNGMAVVPLELPRGSEREAFYQQIAGKNGNQMAAYWSRLVFTGTGRPPLEALSDIDMVAQVSQQPNRIGYVDRSAVDQRVKILFSLPLR